MQKFSNAAAKKRREGEEGTGRSVIKSFTKEEFENEISEIKSLSGIRPIRSKKPVSKSELAQNQMKSTTRRDKPGTGGDEGSGIYDMSNIGRQSYSGHGEDSIEVSGPGQGKPMVGKVKTTKVDPKTLKDEYVTEDDMKGMSVKSGHKRPTKSGAGMTAKGVAAYRRRNPGSKLKTAVTGKVKKGSKDAKRRKSYCARSAGQMKKFPKAAKDPNSRLRQARRRWKC